MASPKIKHAKIIRIINDSVVRGRLSENYLTRKFITRNICSAKYSRITVYGSHTYTGGCAQFRHRGTLYVQVLIFDIHVEPHTSFGTL